METNRDKKVKSILAAQIFGLMMAWQASASGLEPFCQALTELGQLQKPDRLALVSEYQKLTEQFNATQVLLGRSIVQSQEGFVAQFRKEAAGPVSTAKHFADLEKAMETSHKANPNLVDADTYKKLITQNKEEIENNRARVKHILNEVFRSHHEQDWNLVAQNKALLRTTLSGNGEDESKTYRRYLTVYDNGSAMVCTYNYISPRFGYCTHFEVMGKAVKSEWVDVARPEKGERLFLANHKNTPVSEEEFVNAGLKQQIAEIKKKVPASLQACVKADEPPAEAVTDGNAAKPEEEAVAVAPAQPAAPKAAAKAKK